jgi:DNA polymerase III alpha subunit
LYGLYGIVDFYTKAKNFDIKPLLGIELPYISHLASVLTYKHSQKKLGTIVLLATTTQ